MNRKNIAKIIFILSSVVYGVLKTVLLFELYWILLKQNTEIFAIYMQSPIVSLLPRIRMDFSSFGEHNKCNIIENGMMQFN